VSVSHEGNPVDWAAARDAAYAAGAAAAREPVDVPLAEADGHTLAEPVVTLTDLPAFPTSSVDGWAVRGPAPWRIIGRVFAGGTAPPIDEDGTAVEIATGAMVPVGVTAVLRVEESTRSGDTVTGVTRRQPEWREPGEEAHKGEVLLPAGQPVTPAVIGLAASCGYDTLRVRPPQRGALLVFGDELLTEGIPGDGRVRDALGPAVPGWLRRLGATIDHLAGPVQDTLEAHVDALQQAIKSGADLICTTGGTMRGPVDHLHPALKTLGAEYVVNTVGVRPGFPMLLARVKETFVAGLPGNPQSAVVALVSLVAPLLAGAQGRPAPRTAQVTLGEAIPGRGDHTHLALVRVDEGWAYPLKHAGSAMMRGLSQAVGFAVIRPGTTGRTGDRVPLVPLPLMDGERP
jgi:molybdopterin molybdotransferase